MKDVWGLSRGQIETLSSVTIGGVTCNLALTIVLHSGATVADITALLQKMGATYAGAPDSDIGAAQAALVAKCQARS